MSIKAVDSATQSENAAAAAAAGDEFKPTLTSYLQKTEIDKIVECKHASHQYMKKAAFTKLLPAEHWATHGLQKFDETTTTATVGEDTFDADLAQRRINDAFVKRLQDIEVKAANNLEVKLDTYKDWVTVLQRLNRLLLNEFDELEKTIEQHLNLHETRSNHGCRRDVATLVKLIRQAYHDNNWSLAGLNFETITPAEVFGLNENDARDKEILMDLFKEKPSMQKSKADPLRKDFRDPAVMALADEVARMHDEIRRQKDEIYNLEEEIKKAHGKIQIKEDYIKELKNSNMSAKCKECCLRESQTNKMDKTGLGALQSEKQMTNLVPTKTLSDKLNNFHEILNSSFRQNISTFPDTTKLNEWYMKLESDRIEANKRLCTIRSELLNVLGTKHCQDERLLSLQFNDEVLIQAMREYDANQMELKKENDKLIKEKAEIVGELTFLKNNKMKCDEILTELADLLSPMTSEILSYETIYDSEKRINPFCEAICRMRVNFADNIADLKAQLSQEKAQRNQLENELTKLKQLNEETQLKSNNSNISFATNSSNNGGTQNTQQKPIKPPRSKNSAQAALSK